MAISGQLKRTSFLEERQQAEKVQAGDPGPDEAERGEETATLDSGVLGFQKIINNYKKPKDKKVRTQNSNTPRSLF